MKAALQSLKEHSLPDGTPPVEAIPRVGFDDTNPAASRARLAGAFARSSDGKFFAFPTGPSVLGPGSKKLTISSDGIMAAAKELNESQVNALGLEALLLAAITDEAADASNPGRPLQRGGLDASIKPIADSGGLKTAAVSLAAAEASHSACNIPVRF